MNRTIISIFEAMRVDPLIYERYIDEMAARGVRIEAITEASSVSELASVVYEAEGVGRIISSTPTLEIKWAGVYEVRQPVAVALVNWPAILAGELDNATAEETRSYVMRRMFGEGGSELEHAVCEYYGIKPGTFITAMCVVHSVLPATLGVYEGAVINPATMDKMGAKQAVAEVLRAARAESESRGLDIAFSKKLVEDILVIMGILPLVRKSREVESMVVSPADAIKSGRYQVQVRYADEIADAYLECAQDGKIMSCMAKSYGVADGLAMQYGSLHGLHAAVVVYKDMADVAGTRKPVARFLVERAVCTKCGTMHAVVSRRYTDGATFSIPVAEFVAKCIAEGVENSVLTGEDNVACKVCSSPLMTVLDVPVGLEHPIWSDWAPMSLLVEVPGTSDLMELRVTNAREMDQTVAGLMTYQNLAGSHMENAAIDTRSNPEVGRLYELACKLACIEEPPISQSLLESLIGND